MNKIILGLFISNFLFGGCKEESPKNISCEIRKITILSLPDTDYFGKNWDSLDGPDVFMLIVSNLPRNTVLQNTSERFENTTSYPISWVLSRPIIITDLKERLSVFACDFDETETDYMTGFQFNPFEFPDHPAIINLSYKDRNVSINLEVVWK